MISSAEISQLLSNVAEGFHKPSSPLFDKCNNFLLKPYKKLGAICHQDSDYSESDFDVNTKKRIHCNVLNCQEIFDNTSSFQSHYNIMHRFICSECKKSLPTEHLLDLHICEVHDSFFAARVTRGDCIYQCFLEECQEKFCSPMQRKEHCIKDHNFPGNYRFNQTSAGRMKSKIPDDQFSNSDQSCQIEDNKEQHKIFNVKKFSFGHQKEKTFLLHKQNKHKHKDVKQTLEDMDTLKQALDEVPL